MDNVLLKTFSLNDENWLKHANPWSIWSRFATLPFIELAIWSRVWIGGYCLIPLFLLVLWLVINPTLFKAPKTFTSWGSKAVLGERMLLNRSQVPIPPAHQRAITILNLLQTLSTGILAYGLWDLNLHLTLLGTTSLYFSKMWFLDRMVWLYETSIPTLPEENTNENTHK
ncbi:hypothetical protein P3T73_05725 [Kiritimatiellota bacterium B12222]|nr:hypothetical protein P3T73_05725 [Kiritimatiellota bacterium B12222]